VRVSSWWVVGCGGMGAWVRALFAWACARGVPARRGPRHSPRPASTRTCAPPVHILPTRLVPQVRPTPDASASPRPYPRDSRHPPHPTPTHPQPVPRPLSPRLSHTTSPNPRPNPTCASPRPAGFFFHAFPPHTCPPRLLLNPPRPRLTIMRPMSPGHVAKTAPIACFARPVPSAPH
jgi:hypothetical protein